MSHKAAKRMCAQLFSLATAGKLLVVGGGASIGAAIAFFPDIRDKLKNKDADSATEHGSDAGVRQEASGSQTSTAQPQALGVLASGLQGAPGGNGPSGKKGGGKAAGGKAAGGKAPGGKGVRPPTGRPPGGF
eukprot:gnl/TRDRNA2_/TRDRNA2_136207_c0_seq3.p1 gnl/TRDRNA2_/TRDRNA2_136207_c0~~gnl/TRDRNA2_/TRDRNA2_136207_c0_seq3.p1  ORF type:complete len:152 (+),score=27.40 gnl/TRDRNA2_/TRDRNA2_136207_c0_seq3:62-457(+)